MKKIDKTIKIHVSILLAIYIILILSITKFHFIFGSNVDFIRQHAIFPDYFRNLFYETGKIFPEFALHLGGGQNIFYFAYYGFLSPITLLSYLFPFLDMTMYLMLSSILLAFISVLLLYYFLRKNHFHYTICFISSLLFLLSNSFIFHSHRHLMFVNYMPFLLMALLGVIKYFEKHKSNLLIISIFLMILTSFYFSIPGLIVICLYGLYYFLKTNEKAKIKEILLAALKFILRIFLGVLLSCFFLLPIFYIIVNGRNTSNFSLTLSLFFPAINLEYLMYGTYGVGLTSILWITLIYNILFGKKEYRTLSILTFFITLFPFINTMLNGGLYANGKCFIPFLPLYILFIASTIENLEKKKIKWFYFITGIIISSIVLKTKFTYFCFFAFEVIITLLCFYFFQKKKNYYIFAPILIIAFIIFLITNQTDHLITTKEYKNIQEIKAFDYETHMDNDNSLYRFIDNQNSSNMINYSKAKNDYRTTSYSSTTNPYYTNTFYKTFNNNDIYRNKFMLSETNNLFFHRFMGIKYLVTDKFAPFGYKKIKDYNNSTLYQTDYIYPLGFSSSNILNKQEYNKLSFNEQLETFNNNVIIDGKSHNPNLKIQSEKINLNYKVENQENITYTLKKKHYLINSKKNGKLILKLEEEIQDKSLIIRFKMNKIPSCKNGDVAITINDITNKLTCGSWKYYNNNETFDFVLSSNQPINILEILFTTGTYDISDLEIYQIPNTFFQIKENITPLIIKNTYQKNSILNGEIHVKEDGYFLFSIPYDKGFEIIVDKKVQDYELTNEAFIGFSIKKGNHNITLKFHAPLLKLGKLISIFSFLITIILLFKEKRKN